MIREIIDSQNPILRKKSKPVDKIDKKIKSLIADLIDTIKAQKDPEGVGLAAAQIGKNVQVFAMKPKDKVKIVINPEILKVWPRKKDASADPKKNIMEGCLSMPNYYSPIKRAPKVQLKYMNVDGEVKTEIFTGLEAQIVQHEVEHLSGKLFIDHVLKQKKPLYEYLDGEWEEVELF